MKDSFFTLKKCQSDLAMRPVYIDLELKNKKKLIKNMFVS